MAAGGGLYITAIFATVVILIALAVLGKLETTVCSCSRVLMTYEVTGRERRSDSDRSRTALWMRPIAACRMSAWLARPGMCA